LSVTGRGALAGHSVVWLGAAVRSGGAATGDVVVAAILAARLGTSPATVLAPIRAGQATWGSALQALGLAPRDLDGVVRELAAR